MTAVAERSPEAPVTMSGVTMAGALNRALADALSDDETVLVFGEDVGPLGGVFRVTDGLAARFGEARVFDTPLVRVRHRRHGHRHGDERPAPGRGDAVRRVRLSGLRADHQPSGEAAEPDQGPRRAAGGDPDSLRRRDRRRGAPLRLLRGLLRAHRRPAGRHPGHARDAYALLRRAIECPDPVIFLEPKRRYWSRQATILDHAGATLDRAVVRRPGSDVTLIAYGGTLGTALEAADAAAEEGRSIEVIDLRSLSPFDDETVTASVRRTGRAIVVHEASRFCGYGAEVAARLSEQCFHYLEAPVLRVTGFDIPYPPPHLEDYHLPSVDRILDAIDRLQWQETRPAVKAGG